MNEDDVAAIREAIASVANAITPPCAVAGQDAAGGHVASLTEAAMGITAGLVKIADAIDGLAAAIESATERTRSDE